MQFELPLAPASSRGVEDAKDWLRVGSRHLRLALVPNRRARRYVLRLRNDGSARVTVPRGGSAIEARRFAERSVPWIEKQLLRQATRAVVPKSWMLGSMVWFRGELNRLELVHEGLGTRVRLGSELIPIGNPTADLRSEIERHLRALATCELSRRTLELAALHGVSIRRVSVRNQRSRWGSCSRRGTISLNWRLIQSPRFVLDYIVLHELAHVKEMNHSRRFWQEVARLCPAFAEAERWLKTYPELLA